MSVAPFELLDDLLAEHADALGNDRTAYRNHCQRMANFCAALAQADDAAREKIAVAAAFHDIGIWTDRTFDYLEPSAARARAWLQGNGRADWADEVEAMIVQHHKVTPYRSSALAEAFRKADMADVSHGLVAYGLPHALLREAFAAFPNAGFHKRLVQLFAQRLRTHPLSPMPMLRW